MNLVTSIPGKIFDSADDTDEICGLSLKQKVDPDPEIEQPVLGIYLGIWTCLETVVWLGIYKQAKGQAA